MRNPIYFLFFFFNDPAPTEIYTTTDTLSLHDALPISSHPPYWQCNSSTALYSGDEMRSEEHTSELQSPVVISYAVFCLKKKTKLIVFSLRTLFSFEFASFSSRAVF